MVQSKNCLLFQIAGKSGCRQPPVVPRWNAGDLKDSNGGSGWENHRTQWVSLAMFVLSWRLQGGVLPKL